MLQPVGAIVQIAYVVEDIATVAAAYTRALGVGPFHLLEHVEIADTRYKGEPTDIDLSLAIGYSGGVHIELIERHDAKPSVFDHLDSNGFHHFAVMTEHFDASVASYERLGYEVVFSGMVAVGGRFAYMDTSQSLHAMVELIELTPPVIEFFSMMETAAQNWSGDQPLRRLT